MTDIIRTDRHPEFAVSVALGRINDALQGYAGTETDDERETRIWETWAADESFARVSDADAIWFLANGTDWCDPFEQVTGATIWPRSDWDDDEPITTPEYIADLASQHHYAQAATAHPTPDTLRAERDIWIAWQGLKARYERTRNPDMGW